MSAFDVSGLMESDEAAWIAPRLGTAFGAVTTHVPRGFERYARIFHPADPGADETTTWSVVARRCGTVMHPTAQFHALVRNCQDAGPVPQPPALGSLEPTELRALIADLRRHTGTPDDCMFAFWAGWNVLARPTRITTYQHGQQHVHIPRPLPAGAATPSPVGRLDLPGREYALFRGHLDLAERFGDWVNEDVLVGQSPNLFWAADRAWCVATEVDFDSTLVGGNAALVADLLDNPELEVAEVKPTDELHSEADTINI